MKVLSGALISAVFAWAYVGQAQEVAPPAPAAAKPPAAAAAPAAAASPAPAAAAPAAATPSRVQMVNGRYFFLNPDGKWLVWQPGSWQPHTGARAVHRESSQQRFNGQARDRNQAANHQR